MADKNELRNMVLEAVNEAMATVRSEVVDAVTDIAAGDINDHIQRAIGESGLVAETSQEAARKIRSELPPTFKREGNKTQYEHNEKLRDIVRDSLHSISTNDLEKAKSKLEEGKKLIDKRIKLILIADREEDSWEVVKYYEADKLADDTDDEKQIAKARKLAASAKKKRNSDRVNKRRRDQDRSARQSQYDKIYGHQETPQSTGFQGAQSSSHHTRLYNTDRKCFLCHQPGHFAVFVVPTGNPHQRKPELGIMCYFSLV